MSRTQKKKTIQNEELFFNPFSDLGVKATEEGKKVLGFSEDKPATERDANESLSPKTVVSMRIERKGRGGKTVTVVMISPVPVMDQLNALLRSLKKFLGCGASMGNEVLFIQGDQRERIAEGFHSQGIHNIRR